MSWCVAKLDQLSKAGTPLGPEGEALLRTGRALDTLASVMKLHGRVLPPRALQDLVDNVVTSCVNRVAAGIPWTPKWHLMLHIASRARVHGNPRFYATFLDEDYNGRVKKMAAVCHRYNWHSTLLENFRRTFSAQSTRRGQKRKA